MLNEGLGPPRLMLLADITRWEEYREEAAGGKGQDAYLAGLEHGREQLLSELYRRICDGGHPEGCLCDACDVLRAAQQGKDAFLIRDGATREASLIRRRQSHLREPGGNHRPELGHGRDPECIRCQGEPDRCFLDEENWRLCPHADA